MNTIADRKFEHSVGLFLAGHSIRSVMRQVGIARETAHRIQKFTRMAELEEHGFTKVLLGKRADGTLSYYETREIRPNWK